MEQEPHCLLADILGHFVKHFIAAELIFHQRVSLSVGLQAHALAELVHIINVIHPLSVNHLKQNHAL